MSEEDKPKQRRKRKSVGTPPPQERRSSNEMHELAEETSQVIMKMQAELDRLRNENESLKKNRPESQFAKEFAQEIVKNSEDIDLHSLPLKTLDDYKYYNKIARKQKKPMKCAPVSFFPKMKVKFIRRDGQQGNPLKVRRRDAVELIDFKETLMDNAIYELPVPIINWLNSLGVKRYKEVKNSEGMPEMFFSHYDYRFSCQMVA